MMSKFSQEELLEMSPEVNEHFNKLLTNGVILEKEDGYYFPSLDDPYNEKAKSKIKVLEYVVWNLAAQTYLETNDE